MKRILKKLLAVFAIIGLFLLSQIPDIVMLVLEKRTNHLDLGQTLIILMMQLCVIVGFYFLARKKELISPGTQYWLSWKSVKIAVLGILTLFVVRFIGVMILILEGKTTTNNQENVLKLFDSSPLLLLFVMIVIMAPLTEEIIFRGLIPKLFSKRFEGLGFGLGTLLFSLAHSPTDIGSFVIYAGMGAVLAVICYRTKHLEYSIWVHALNNGLSFFQILLALFLKK
ncbi:CPBP family intramembrane glutamic endopeptidase [Streptococcus macacae]|uniref:CAAX amino terminal protease family protein n=1 Tax=Streptococcus macacae NCTC 11558 TaxID=764298 RepID=G5JWB6_9STRE|nr:type II CAAX endopeptidase family protein [Streptococcus macacae]EHJ52585.1 CAAX amino terminal protease family protein [Streptococcus macacae NCTC 11558]SUN77771.1 CAAX amino terminal protease family protein [Streptococcus macacae NCTC 11558]